ncbi:MAG: AarF/UbiB family protein, partial [Pseudomonadota bacterium]
DYWLPSLRRFKLAEVTSEFEEMIKFELDLRFEAASAVQLKKNLRDDSGFYVPEIYWNYTSQKILTLERIDGIAISDLEAIKKAGHNPARIVDEAAIGFFTQVFRDGFFHADMHPGNMFILPDGRIAIIDFGIMGMLDLKSRLYLAQILNYALKEDYYNLAKVHFDAGFVPPHKSVEKFALAMMAIMKPIVGRNLGDISVANLLGQLFTTAKAFEMESQPHLLLLQKNMMLTEGVGRMLNPDVNMWQVVEPLIEDWAKQNFGVKAQIKEKAKQTFNIFKTLPDIITQAESALERVNDGGFKLHRDTVSSMKQERNNIHDKWLVLAWTALIIFTLAYITK